MGKEVVRMGVNFCGWPSRIHAVEAGHKLSLALLRNRTSAILKAVRALTLQSGIFRVNIFTV